jgi:hypothetical protein
MFNFKKLSIIIVNYQSEAYLQKCLASLFQYNLGIDFEIVIVNNDPEKNLEGIREKFPEVVLIDAPENKGFAAACNLGVKNSQGDLLFFLNPDTEIFGSLDPIIGIFEKNPQIGAIGPKLLEKNGKIQEWSAGVEISLWDLIGNNLGWLRSRKIWESPETREASWVSGAALFTPRKVFSEVGGFDDNFFLYFEDNDLCRRIKQTGKKILYFPSIAIKHWGGKSFRDEKNKKNCYYQAQDYYFQKYHGNFSVFWLKILRKIFLKKADV